MRTSLAAVAALLMGLTIGGVSATAQPADPTGPTTPRCPAGANPDRPGEIEQQRPPASSWVPAVFDPATARILVFPMDEGSSSDEAWAFDVCTNSWSLTHLDPGAAGPSHLAALAAEIGSGAIVGVGDGQTWVYDPGLPGWDARGPAPAEGLVRLAYDPVHGRLLGATTGWGQTGFEPPRLWSYESDAAAWTEVRVSGDIPDPDYSEYLLYAVDPGGGVLVAYDAGSGRTWRLDQGSSTWTEARQGPPLGRIGWLATGGEVAVHAATGQIVFYSDELVLGYDPGADAWQVLCGDPGASFPIGPLARVGHSMVYDPVNERLVVMSGDAFTGDAWVGDDGDVPVWASLDDVWAFDVGTRGWIQLLAPTSPPQPAAGGPAWGEEPESCIEPSAAA